MLVRMMEQNGGRKSRWTVPLTKQKNHTTLSQVWADTLVGHDMTETWTLARSPFAASVHILYSRSNAVLPIQTHVG